MTSKPKNDRIKYILDSLKKAADGDYSTKLDFASDNDDLGRIVEAVNALLQKTEERFSSFGKTPSDLLEDAHRYRHILDNIEESYFEVDLHGNLTFFNYTVILDLGYSEEELRGINFRKLVDEINAAKVYKAFHQVFTTGQPIKGFDWQILKKNKEIIDVESSVALLHDVAGNPAGFRGIVRNVSQRVQDQKVLRESEKLYRMIVENMQDVIWVMDFNLQYKYRSPSSMRITGYTAEEIMTIPPREQMTPESYALAENILLEELTREKSGLPLDPHRVRTMDLEVYRKDGGTAWIEVTATFNRNEHGEPFEIVLAARDITSRRQIEGALRESEQRYRMIVENVHDSIALLDLNLDYLYISPAEIRITGFTPEEIMNIPLKDQVTPESYSLLEKIFSEELAREFSGEPIDPERSQTMELEVYHKNGGTVWVELTAIANRDENGHVVGILVSTHDITKRKRAQEDLKQSEQRYRMIIENMHEVIWTNDLNFRYTYASPSCARVTGYTPEEIISMPIDQIITPESLVLAQTALTEEMMREFSSEPADLYRSRTMELEFYHKNGGTVWMDVTTTFTRDESGKPVGLLSASRDITERKKAQEAKNNLEEQLIQAQKMETVGRLAGGVAHDFNNMLSVILGYVDLAKLRLARQHPVLKDIAEIEKAAIRSRDITTQLLAFSRKQIIEPIVIDLNELVSHTQKALMRLIGEDIDLTFVEGEGLWPLMFDPSQIEQILINLAVNARDAMPGGGKLTVETANVILDAAYCLNNVDSAPGHYVRLSFSDSGTGMDKKTMQSIFEPFFTTKEMGKGTGLGLSTVYGIVKQNNGYINVYSEPGHGSTFSIYLPRTFGEREAPDESDREEEITGQGNILLVEDDAMVLQITKGMLESIGYSVMSTNNPREALSLCQNPATAIDLVITDVVMPGMSGKELRDGLLTLRPDIKVLFMSGYTADVIAHHGVLEEGVMFLQKPFSLKALAGKVVEVMAVK